MKERHIRPGMPLPDFSNRSENDGQSSGDSPGQIIKPEVKSSNPAAALSLAVESASPKADAQTVVPAPGLSARSSTPNVSSDVAGKVEQVGASHTLRLIPISLIDPNPLAPREVYTPEMIRDRATDLSSQGQHDPIHVIPNPDAEGRYIICDGWTRVLACREHKVLDALRADVHFDLSVEESAWFGYQQNEGRSQHCDLDRAMFYEKMISTGLSATEVARRAGISKTLMSFYRSYSKMPAGLMEVVQRTPHKFGATYAPKLVELAEKVGERRAISLAEKYVEEEQTTRWLLDMIAKALEPVTRPRATVPSRQFRYTNGFFRQKGNTFELGISVPQEKIHEFSKSLDALLATVVQVDAPDSSVDSEH